MRLHYSTTFGVALAIVGLWSASCTSTPEAPKPTPASSMKTAGKHSVQTPQLQALMKVISMTAADYTPKTLPADVETPKPAADLEKAYAQASVLADALVTAADRIPFAIEDKPLSKETREGFLSEAKRLKQSAVELKDHASHKQGEAMTRALDRINATCITCHSRYRDLTGTLDAPRAALGLLD
ncbi:cytochrome c [Humisphaera borealis]|uniref:Cytochrome c n=1 Tax=Humisphaera borealis TaxID=2807512 RepID=A0A7M2WVE0_9BACT|nr:cytochrome c [Humisphaera borealis]QOV89284.1 cytochrome c [Humisphaera borealis]